MRLSPIEVYDREFKKGFHMRSYDPVEVDEFLDEVATDYEALYHENQRLSKKIKEMESDLSRYKKVEGKIKNKMKAAQETAEEKESQADYRARVIIEKAELKAREIVSNARHKMQEKYSQLEKMQELAELFRIRFRTLLEAHLELLENEDKLNLELDEQKAELEPELDKDELGDFMDWLDDNESSTEEIASSVEEEEEESSES